MSDSMIYILLGVASVVVILAFMWTMKVSTTVSAPLLVFLGGFCIIFAIGLSVHESSKHENELMETEKQIEKILGADVTLKEENHLKQIYFSDKQVYEVALDKENNVTSITSGGDIIYKKDKK